MSMLLWLSFAVACLVSFVVWVGNLNVASSISDAPRGIWLLRGAWGVFLALVVLKLVMG
jgi:hypothetical protein